MVKVCKYLLCNVMIARPRSRLLTALRSSFKGHGFGLVTGCYIVDH